MHGTLGSFFRIEFEDERIEYVCEEERDFLRFGLLIFQISSCQIPSNHLASQSKLDITWWHLASTVARILCCSF